MVDAVFGGVNRGVVRDVSSKMKNVNRYLYDLVLLLSRPWTENEAPLQLSSCFSWSNLGLVQSYPGVDPLDMSFMTECPGANFCVSVA